MPKPKRVDADDIVRRYYEAESSDHGAFPEDTLAPLTSARSRSSDEGQEDIALAGGDPDATGNLAHTGEEAVGGSSPTPDQDVVQELGEAVGVTYDDAEPLRFGDKMADRDARRWELNPASSEGYQERVRELIREPVTPKRPERARRPRIEKPEQGASGRRTARAQKARKKGR